MGIVQPPTGGLIGYSNYNLYDDCENLRGVSVTVQVTEQMVAIPSAESAAGIQSNGIGFQLNCLPRAGGEITWQQYIMVVSRTGEDLRWGVNNWDNNSAHTDGIIDQGGDLATLPSSFGAGYASIPAGYRLQMTLSNDANDNISGATFSMYDQNGVPVFQPKTVELTSLTDVNGNQITVAELSPIVDIDFVIVGYANSADTTLSQGAGTITYQATNSLTVLNTFPPCTAGVNTAESSNVTYGVLDSSPGAEIVQTFQAPPPGVANITASSGILWAGFSVTCTVTLNRAAPTGGTPVTLSLSGEYGTAFSGVALSTSVLEISGGATLGTFHIIASATAWGAVTITAAGLDDVVQSTSVLVVAGEIALSTATVSPKSGQPITFTVYVRTHHPSSGQITLSATNPVNIVVSGMPSSILLGAGATSAQFKLVATLTRAVGRVTITATYEGNSASTVVTLDTVHVTPPRTGGKFPV